MQVVPIMKLFLDKIVTGDHSQCAGVSAYSSQNLPGTRN
jgi:hypothetical protein